MKNTLYKSILLATSTLGAGLAMPAVAQEGQGLQLEEIIVTARRREERLQDVPISMTVFNQEQLSNANINTTGDLATNTPSLQTNSRFGQDNTIFQIRGFTQELRTTASVGVYFAEVVAPRGANTSSSGDGAGPGDLFDLENVQILKGPQGTLFGRNTTGGAVLLSPKKPTEELEGYAEISAGNYDMQRMQGVINLPVSDSIRLRFGVDDQRRGGHLQNVSGIGPEDMADIDYTAFRASAVIDITDNLENYTIFKMVDSENNNTPASLVDCNPAGSFGGLCAGDQANRRAKGLDGFYDVWSNHPDPVSTVESWQGINTTTWEVNDNLTVKNILSYAEFGNRNRNRIFGTNWQFPTGGGPREIVFGIADESRSGRKTGDSNTFVEEFQLQGTALDDRLTWQTGFYYEKTEPTNDYGSQSFAQISCDPATYQSANPAEWRCNDLFARAAELQFGLPPGSIHVGSQQSAPGGVEYENKAIFAQGTYDLTDQLALTAGVRYTDDETTGYVAETLATFPGNLTTGAYAPPDSIRTIYRNPEASSDEPTWLLGLDYKPTDDTLLYAKYARGYRQGSVNLAGTPPFDTHNPESVDTYELGTKMVFATSMPMTLNAAVFYNDLTDQQLQLGYLSINGTGTTAVVNAGASTIMGLELEGNILLTENLSFSAGYAYLDTEVDSLDYPDISSVTTRPVTPSTAEGESLPLTPENKLVATLSYRIPIDEAMGDLTTSVTYIYVDEMQSSSPSITRSPYAILPDYDLINLNMNWNSVASSPVDLALYVTNLADEEYYTYITGQWLTGLEYGQVGLPRMYGIRAKYNF